MGRGSGMRWENGWAGRQMGKQVGGGYTGGWMSELVFVPPCKQRNEALHIRRERKVTRSLLSPQRIWVPASLAAVGFW